MNVVLSLWKEKPGDDTKPTTLTKTSLTTFQPVE